MARLKYEPKCRWCKAVKADPKLLKRIYRSRKYTGKGETLKAIAFDVNMPYLSLVQHCKLHQGLTDDDLATAKVEQIARETSNQLIQSNIHSGSARQTVVDNLMHVLSTEDFQSLDPDKKVNLLLKALKDTDDVSAKRKDQDIDILKMMARGRSGEAALPLVEGEIVEAELFDPWTDSQEIEDASITE